MGLNLEKLQALADNQWSDKLNHKDFQFKPPLGESRIRIIPSPHIDTCITPIDITYGITKFPIVSLKHFGDKQDPITDYVNRLYARGTEADKALADRIKYKTRYFCPIIVRGQESEGVKILDFPYSVLTTIVEDTKDAGNFIDPQKGRDYKVIKYPEWNKAITLKIALEQTVLSDDPALVEKWIKNQPNPLDFYNELSYDDIKEHLKTFLTDTWPSIKDDVISQYQKRRTNTSDKKGDVSELFDTTLQEKAPKVSKPDVSQVSEPVRDEPEDLESEDDLPF